MTAKRFFDYARERHAIYLRRKSGVPEPWTKEPILRQYRFTNVFRELDKTTFWFSKYVRTPMRAKPEVLLATVVFRMLNRIESGEAIFCQRDMITNESAFDEFATTGKPGPMRGALRQFVGEKGPFVTGAYIISSPPGHAKVDGMMKVLKEFYDHEYADADWRKMADYMLRHRGKVTLQETWEYLKSVPFLGKFHSYEIVTDLRHTKLLDKAPDIMTWCNVGPGARRGINRVTGRNYRDVGSTTEQMLGEMRQLLALSRDKKHWPQGDKDYPAWEMRDVEHTLCEFDKMERVRLGQGRPRGRFR